MASESAGTHDGWKGGDPGRCDDERQEQYEYKMGGVPVSTERATVEAERRKYLGWLDGVVEELCQEGYHFAYATAVTSGSSARHYYDLGYDADVAAKHLTKLERGL